MTLPEIAEKLNEKLPGAVTEVKAEGVPNPFLKISAGLITAVGGFLREDPGLQFDYLMCLSGVDYGKGMLGVVYHLYSMTHRHRLTVKVDVPADKPELDSVSGIWPSANWHEREAFDMYGIVFNGHPDLRRILLPEDYPGHPLRKDFKVPEFYQGMKVPY